MTLHTEERQTPAGLASTLSWTATGALIWLRRMGDTATPSADDKAKLADYGRRLRECADHLDTLCSEESDGR